MATVPIPTQSVSRGSKYELSYASPMVLQICGDQPDRECLKRHESKRRSGGFNDEGGKLGDDGRKRRSWGRSDDKGRLTYDNLHNEDLRVGWPYLCSIRTANIPVPKRHVKFRLTCLETDEGWELGQKILNIIDKYHLNQRDVSLRFSFFGRQSIIDPEPQPCLTLYIPAHTGTVDDTWLQCARELRVLLISNDLASCSVEIVDPMVFKFFDEIPRHIPESFAPRSFLQSLEMHGLEVFMDGYRSGNRTGAYNGLRVANIEAQTKEGVVTTVTTLGYSITGLNGEAFSVRGDSGAMATCKREIAAHTKRSSIGMIFAGFETERIICFTRLDFLLDDIKEMTKARDIEVFWSA